MLPSTKAKKIPPVLFFNVSMFDHTKVWLKRLLLTKVQESLYFVLSQKNSVQISKVSNTMQWDSDTAQQWR